MEDSMELELHGGDHRKCAKRKMEIGLQSVPMTMAHREGATKVEETVEEME